MPNHVTNILKAPKKVLDALAGDEVAVDFNVILPIPEDDDPIYTATRTDWGDGAVGWSLNGISPMDLARTTWGTKWNAYSIEVQDDSTVKFETAWSHPFPVIQALSARFPEETIHVKFADEDFGYNLGEYAIQGGETISETPIEAGSEEALEFAANLLYGKPYAELKAEWDAEEAEWTRKYEEGLK